MKAALFALLLFAVPAYASVSVKRASEKPKLIDVVIVDEPLSSAVKALAPHLPHRAQLVIGHDPRVTYRAKRIAPDAALREIVAAANATLTVQRNQYWIQNVHDATVTMDVKDQDIRVILKDMQRQCRIKNLVIDPQVSGNGTFIFENLPCRTAFNVVFRTLGLASMDYGNSVVSVERRQ